MPNVRLIPLNASGGAFVTINASIPCRRVELMEDEATTPQGLIYQSVMDNFVTTNTVGPSTEPVILGNVIAIGNAKGPVLGYPVYSSGGSSIAATPLVKVKSGGAAVTTLRVTEYE